MKEKIESRSIDGENNVDYYRRTRDLVDKASIREGNKLDNVIFVLATGAFVLSINMLIGGKGPFICLWSLILSWIFLLISIISHVLSYIFAQFRFEDVIERLDKWHDNFFNPPGFIVGNKFRDLIKGLNLFSAIFLGLGVIFLTIFAINNIYNSNKMSNEIVSDNNKPNGQEKSVDQSLPSFQPEKEGQVGEEDNPRDSSNEDSQSNSK